MLAICPQNYVGYFTPMLRLYEQCILGQKHTYFLALISTLQNTILGINILLTLIKKGNETLF